MSSRPPATTRRAAGATMLVSDERGAVMTEYVVITGFVGLVSVPAILFCAWALAGHFAYVRDYVLFPFP